MATAPTSNRNLLPVVIVSVLIAAVVVAWRAAEIARDEPVAVARALGVEAANAPAPPMKLDAIGGRFDLGSTRGQFVFVNFWATWCPPCVDEFPSMLALGRDLSARYPGRFKMVAVSVDDAWEPVLRFLGGPPAPWLTVARDPDQSVTRAYYCAARGGCPKDYKFPESYFVGPDGKIVGFVVGPKDWNGPAIRRYFDRLLKG
jgi:thiol-disulfide isomerase/thioredoxin